MLTLMPFGITPGYVVMPLGRPVSIGAVQPVMSAILHEPVELEMVHPGSTSTSFLASRLEQSYVQHLENLLGRGSNRDIAPTIDVPTVTNRKHSIGHAREAMAMNELAAKLPQILARSGCASSASSSTLWGVSLTSDDNERASLLAAFLRAREWDVAKAETFLLQTLTWRRLNGLDVGGANGLDAASERAGSADVAFPDDVIATRELADASDSPRMLVVLHLGAVGREALGAAEAIVAWRVRMQEKACAALREHWATAPRGPTYTLVLDCRDLRPFHFGRASRRSLGALTSVLTCYYPDFVDETVVVNAPGFLRGVWGLVSRLMPAWWGVRIETSLEELERREGLCLHA